MARKSTPKAQSKPAAKAAPKKPAPAKPAPKKPAPVRKQTGEEISSIAGAILGGKKATQEEAIRMAASLVSQDETKGKQKPK